METFTILLALCVGNSLVTGEFPSQRPMMKSFDIFFDLCLNKWLNKQSGHQCLRCHHTHYDATVMARQVWVEELEQILDSQMLIHISPHLIKLWTHKSHPLPYPQKPWGVYFDYFWKIKALYMKIWLHHEKSDRHLVIIWTIVLLSSIKP